MWNHPHPIKATYGCFQAKQVQIKELDYKWIFVIPCEETAELVISKFILNFKSYVFFSSGNKLNPLKAPVQGSSLSTWERLFVLCWRTFTALQLKRELNKKKNPEKQQQQNKNPWGLQETWSRRQGRPAQLTQWHFVPQIIYVLGNLRHISIQAAGRHTSVWNE